MKAAKNTKNRLTKKPQKAENNSRDKQTSIEALRTIDSRTHFDQLIFANNVFIVTTTFNAITNYHDTVLHLMISAIIAKIGSNKKDFFNKNKSKNTFKSIKILV